MALYTGFWIWTDAAVGLDGTLIYEVAAGIPSSRTGCLLHSPGRARKKYVTKILLRDSWLDQLTGMHEHFPSIHVSDDEQVPQFIVTPQLSIKPPQLRPAVAQVAVWINGSIRLSVTMCNWVEQENRAEFTHLKASTLPKNTCICRWTLATKYCWTTIVCDIATAETSSGTGNFLQEIKTIKVVRLKLYKVSYKELYFDWSQKITHRNTGAFALHTSLWGWTHATARPYAAVVGDIIAAQASSCTCYFLQRFRRSLSVLFKTDDHRSSRRRLKLHQH